MWMFSGKTIRLEEEAKQVGLKINTGKTKTLRMNAGNQEKIEINDQEIEAVDQFTYLGAPLCKEGGGMKGLKNSKKEKHSLNSKRSGT